MPPMPCHGAVWKTAFSVLWCTSSVTTLHLQQRSSSPALHSLACAVGQCNAKSGSSNSWYGYFSVLSLKYCQQPDSKQAQPRQKGCCYTCTLCFVAWIPWLWDCQTYFWHQLLPASARCTGRCGKGLPTTFAPFSATIVTQKHMPKWLH